MQSLARLIGWGFIALCLLAVALKAMVPLPGPLGYAPIDLGFGAKAEPVEVVIWYGTEKRAWLEEAARRFEAAGATSGGRPIRITLVGLGSREIAERVANKDWGDAPPPAVISPASSVWVEQLRADWAAQGGDGAIISGAAPPLVLTPLVAVAWQQRADLLWRNGEDAFWRDLGEAIASESWVSVVEARGFAAGSPEHNAAQSWGFVKFGHTSPLTSNSGAQTLALMAYAFHGKTGGLTTADVNAPAFQDWLEAVAGRAVNFGASTGDLMTSLVQRGPSSFDVVMVYENLALESVRAAEGRWGQPVRVYYPPATLLSDHPYAILGEALTMADERAAAERFRDYLLSEPIQALALEHGFRPALASVSVTGGGAANPFSALAAYGVRVDAGPQVETPAPEVTRALLELWERRIAPLTLRQRP